MSSLMGMNAPRTAAGVGGTKSQGHPVPVRSHRLSCAQGSANGCESQSRSVARRGSWGEVGNCIEPEGAGWSWGSCPPGDRGRKMGWGYSQAQT